MGIDCQQSHCYLENIHFSANENHHSGAQLIGQTEGILQVTNSSFSESSNLIRQKGGTLEIVDSDFLVNGHGPAISSDRKIRICGSQFDCVGSCSTAIDFKPYTPDCQPVTLEHSQLHRFPQSINLASTPADHSFRVPVTIEATSIGQSMTGKGIVFDGSLDLSFNNNTLNKLHTALVFKPQNEVTVKRSSGNIISADIILSGCPARGKLCYSTPALAVLRHHKHRG